MLRRRHGTPKIAPQSAAGLAYSLPSHASAEAGERGLAAAAALASAADRMCRAARAAAARPDAFAITLYGFSAATPGAALEHTAEFARHLVSAGSLVRAEAEATASAAGVFEGERASAHDTNTEREIESGEQGAAAAAAVGPRPRVAMGAQSRR